MENGKLAARTEAIDKLLRGRTSETRANVLEYMMKYGIDPENEFFIIFVALGELETLIENSPQQWRELFEQFKEVLEKWAQTNIETLKQLAHKAEVTELLAANSEKLSNSLVKLLEVCERLMNQLQESNGLLVNSLSRLQTSETELKTSVEQTRSDLSRLHSQIEVLNSLPVLQSSNSTEQKRRAWTWKDRVLVGGIAIAVAIFCCLYVEQRQVSQRVQWLLEKANRQDCLTGIKKSNSPECRGF
jgi:small-conductance mechanosensitive channel